MTASKIARRTLNLHFDRPSESCLEEAGQPLTQVLGVVRDADDLLGRIIDPNDEHSLQRVTGRIAHRFVLRGDAAGYVDAITGEGLSLAFEGAAELARQWPTIEAGRGSVESLTPYARAMERLFTPYARLARLLVFVAAHPTLRRFAIDRLIARPALFEWALAM